MTSVQQCNSIIGQIVISKHEGAVFLSQESGGEKSCLWNRRCLIVYLVWKLVLYLLSSACVCLRAQLLSGTMKLSKDWFTVEVCTVLLMLMVFMCTHLVQPVWSWSDNKIHFFWFMPPPTHTHTNQSDGCHVTVIDNTYQSSTWNLWNKVYKILLWFKLKLQNYLKIQISVWWELALDNKYTPKWTFELKGMLKWIRSDKHSPSPLLCQWSLDVERTSPWPQGQEVTPQRRQKLIKYCVFAVWDAPLDQLWHAALNFPGVWVWGQAIKWPVCWEKDAAFTQSRKLMAERMTLSFTCNQISVKWHEWLLASSVITLFK